MSTTTESGLATANQLQDIATNGAAILESNVTRADKAVAVGENILTAIAENGMTEELDKRCNNYLVNCRTAKKEMEETRKPITSFFDTIKKMYTEAEAKVDVAKADSLPARVQSQRNAYVAKLRQEEERRQAEQQRKINVDNEKIEIKAAIERQLSEYTQNHILARKKALQDSFNSITLENFVEKSANLRALKLTYKQEHFHAFVPVCAPKFCTVEDVQSIKIEFMQGQDFNLIAAVIEGELAKFVAELVEKLPSLKNQLQELEKAGEEERKRLQQEKVNREKREEEELQRKADEEARKKQEEIEMRKSSDQTEAMMENLTLSNEGNTPETRSGFNIVITHPGGVLEIVNFWFQKEGINLSIAEIEKKSIAQMKTFCQNYAHKHDEKISSKFLTYEPTYKAVNRK